MCVLLWQCAAWGEGIDGLGRISIGGGFRWVPNWWFIEKAAQAGTPVIPGLSGGPQATVSFGYGATSWIECAVDFLVGYERFALALPEGGRLDYTSVTYGALIGVRAVASDFLVAGLMPYVSGQLGPVLSNISAPHESIPEKALLAFSAGGGLTYRLNSRFGLAVEARYLYGRNQVPPISGINVGGVWFSAMLTLFFPPTSKRDLDLPGF